MPWQQYAYPSVDEVLAAHEAAMERSGYHPTPLLFPDRLVSALARPQYAAHYGGADLIAQAATLIICVPEAQAFEQGNKRTALEIGMVFLEMNGFEYAGDSELLAVVILENASPSSHEDAIRNLGEWIRPQIKKLF